jgi:hypothetical protein
MSEPPAGVKLGLKGLGLLPDVAGHFGELSSSGFGFPPGFGNCGDATFEFGKLGPGMFGCLLAIGASPIFGPTLMLLSFCGVLLHPTKAAPASNSTLRLPHGLNPISLLLYCVS